MLRQRPIIIEIYRRFNRTLNIMASSFVPIFYMVQDHLRSAFFKCKPTIFLHKYRDYRKSDITIPWDKNTLKYTTEKK